MKILTIIGARPQFVKAAVVSRAFAQAANCTEVIVHTGQHFQANMSAVFFEEMNIAPPAYNLNCNGNEHENLLLQMVTKIKEIIVIEKPEIVLVYGDTNSTLAGSLAAEAMQVPIAHVEAGLRSFNRAMIEEYNRIITDKLASYCFCPTQTAVENLANEEITKNVFLVGDVMFDAVLAYTKIAEEKSNILSTHSLQSQNYYLATVHRAENTDTKENLKQIFDAFSRIATPECPIILPLHPRTKKCLEEFNLQKNISTSVKIISPVGYFDMLMLEKNAKTIFTDSGGMQKEAYFHKVPCITLRNETEWVETVNSGWNQLAGAQSERIEQALANARHSQNEINCYGKGDAAQKIADFFNNL